MNSHKSNKTFRQSLTKGKKFMNSATYSNAGRPALKRETSVVVTADVCHFSFKRAIKLKGKLDLSLSENEDCSPKVCKFFFLQHSLHFQKFRMKHET